MLKLSQIADIVIDVANPGTQYGQKLSKAQKIAAILIAYFIIIATSCACLFIAYLLLRAHHYFITIIPVYIAFCFLYKIKIEIAEMIRRIRTYR